MLEEQEVGKVLLTLCNDLLDRNRLRVADFGVAGGCRLWPLAAAAAEDKNVEKYRPEPSLTGLRIGGGV